MEDNQCLETGLISAELVSIATSPLQQGTHKTLSIFNAPCT